MRSTGLVAPGGSGWPGAMPTDSDTCGATIVPAPIEMCSSPKHVAGREGEQRARRRSGAKRRAEPVVRARSAPAHRSQYQSAVGDGGRQVSGIARRQVTAEWLVDGAVHATSRVTPMDGRQRISSGSPYEPTVGYSRAVRVGDRVVAAGTAPQWPDGTVDPDAGAQARRCFEIIGAALEDGRRVVRRRRAHPRVPRRRGRLRRRSPRCTARCSATSVRPTPRSSWPRCSNPRVDGGDRGGGRRRHRSAAR